MELKEIICGLRKGAPDKHRCFGCGYEHNCGIHGCQVMKEAATQLELFQTAIHRIEKMHEHAKGTEKAIYGEVLSLLGGKYEGKS